jgi:hypothetical protein
LLTTIRELLAIEKSAKKAASDTEADDGLTLREIEKGVAALEQGADERIALYEREAQTETEARLTQIRQGYKRKADRLQASFFVNRETWLAEVVGDILYGLYGGEREGAGDDDGGREADITVAAR